MEIKLLFTGKVCMAEVVDKGYCAFGFIEGGNWVRVVAKRQSIRDVERLYCEAYLANGGCWLLGRCRFDITPVGNVVLGKPEDKVDL
jgi:hypothetical protein